MPNPIVEPIRAALAGLAVGQADDRPLLVAFSGGLDSTVLLHAAARALGPQRCVAAHVHHGLQAAADAWPAHCVTAAASVGVHCETLRLQGAPVRGESPEDWARIGRYDALVACARRIDARAILTAHHADDQVETLLMRLSRGTGPAGLRGIRARAALREVPVLRPLLALQRDVLRAYAQAHGLRWIEDPTNTDTARLRNAFRHQVLPVIDTVAPAFRANLLRAADLITQAQDAVEALAQIDLASAASTRERLTPGVPENALRIEALVGLTPARRHAALRLWIARAGLPSPTAARLAEIDRQLLTGAAPRGRVHHAGVQLCRDRGWLFQRSAEQVDQAVAPVALRWRGEHLLEIPVYRGALHFEPTLEDDGVSAHWLRDARLCVLPGSSSARLRPATGSRQRTLKNLYQEAGVPAFARAGLPLVYADDALLFAAGIGMDHAPARPREGACVRLRWEPSAV